MLESLKRRINSWIEKREKIAEAKQVYRNCRGTNHKEMLKKDISRLEEIINEKQEEKSKRNQQRRKIRSKLNSKHNKKAFRRYFKENYTSIEGVGDKYSKKILQKTKRTSNTQWSDLEHMGNKIINRSKSIKGIGQKTYSDLKNWHYHNRGNIEKLSTKLKNDEEVFANEKEKIKSLKQKASSLDKEIKKLKELKKKPSQALERLKRTSVNDFIKASLDSGETPKVATKVNEFLKGFYPPWGDQPPWHDDVQTVLKNENTKSLQSSEPSNTINNQNLKEVLNKIKQKRQ